MERQQNDNVEIPKEEIEESQEDAEIDRWMTQQEITDSYPSPESEEKQNQHSFLHKAAFGEIDTVRTTFLSESELGRPLFSIRFMLKMEDIAKYYLDNLIKTLGMNPMKQNKIANYFNADIKNTSDSGMSNKGFAMNLNVTRKMDAVRKRVRDIPNEKGGNK